MRATTPSAIPPPAPPLRVRSEDDQRLELLGRQERLHARHKSSLGLHVAKSAEWWATTQAPTAQFSPRTLSQECGSLDSALLRGRWPRVAMPFREQSGTLALKPLPD